MARAKPVLDWVRRMWRAYCAVRTGVAELNPGGLLRLAEEMRRLTDLATDPDAHRLDPVPTRLLQ